MCILEKAKKYECPIKFDILDCDAGWTKMSCNFGGRVLEFDISEIGDQPRALIESLYIFNAWYDNYPGLLSVELESLDHVPDQHGDVWDDVEMIAKFQWDEEPRLNDWTLRQDPKDFGKDEFTLHINIVRSLGGGRDTYDFDVSYRDLCYATAKCFTECLQREGLYGYHRGSYTDDINIRQLLIIKAYALGLLNNTISVEPDPNDKYDFNFNDELKLLIMDM